MLGLGLMGRCSVKTCPDNGIKRLWIYENHIFELRLKMWMKEKKNSGLHPDTGAVLYQLS